MKSTRADSIAGAVTAAQDAALGPLLPPAHVKLRDGDIEYWNAIMSARARSTWTDVDLAKAATLARCQADIERLTTEMEDEPDTVMNAAGTPVINPKLKIIDMLVKREVALARAVHVHAVATVGRSEDASAKLEAEREAKAAQGKAKGASAASLIPGLRAVK